MLSKVLNTTAKTLLIAAGMGFGLIRGMRLLDGLADRSAEMGTLRERLEEIHSQIAALQSRDHELRVRMEHAVTRDEFSTALDKAFERVQGGIDVRFEEQARAVEALRAMVGQTDELLERLLDRLESMRNDAELEHVGS